MSIQEKWTLPLMQGQGNVYGTAVSEDEKGNLRATVYTQCSGTADLLDTIDGLPVHVEVIGQMFDAGPAKDDRLYANGVPRKRSGAMRTISRRCRINLRSRRPTPAATASPGH